MDRPCGVAPAQAAGTGFGFGVVLPGPSNIPPGVNFSSLFFSSSLPLSSPGSPPAGIKLTLSALLDGKNVNAGGHKLGLGLEFQA